MVALQIVSKLALLNSSNTVTCCLSKQSYPCLWKQYIDPTSSIAAITPRSLACPDRRMGGDPSNNNPQPAAAASVCIFPAVLHASPEYALLSTDSSKPTGMQYTQHTSSVGPMIMANDTEELTPMRHSIVGAALNSGQSWYVLPHSFKDLLCSSRSQLKNSI